MHGDLSPYMFVLNYDGINVSLDRSKIIEKAFSLDWCRENFVLVDSTIYKKDGLDHIKVYVSDLENLSVLGEFIISRLRSKCHLNPEFESASKEEIVKVLDHLKLLQKRQSENKTKLEENKKNKPQILADEGIMIQPHDETIEEQITHEDDIDLSLKFSTLEVLGWGSIVLTVLGCFVPLIKVPLIGSMNYLYGGRGDGVIVLICSLVSSWFLLQGKLNLVRYTAFFSLTVVFCTFWTFVIAIQNIHSSLADNPFKELMNVGLEIGWLLMFLGPIGLLVRSFIRMDSKRATISKKEFGLILKYVFTAAFAGLAFGILFNTFNVVFGD